MQREDQALVERSQRGELEAFEALVEKYRQRVWRLAFNVLRDREEAWDVAQEAFVRAWQALGNFRGQSAFYTWLFRITMNVASDRLRQRGARGRAFGTERVGEEEMERTMADTDVSPDERAARTERRERIQQALAALPEHHRTIIMLSDLEGLSYREIADVLEIPMGTVMSRLHNARKKLRDVLGPMLAALILVLGALLPAVLDAQQMVRFGARVVLAGDGPPPAGIATSPPPTEQRIQRVLPRLREMFRFREYTWLDRYRAEVPVGTTQRWDVPGGRRLEVTPESVVGGAVRMRVTLMRGSKTEVTTNIQAGSGQPAVIGGPRHGDGVLIFIIWANANPR
ncbi:MAG: sigma-70 family RNA polymerase sigma factor [Candidatus Rokubacteria bacterium]|nr:sigma-70 family RNA polymerase sigma factor [Candidatus Rokubacteria bacterium]